LRIAITTTSFNLEKEFRTSTLFKNNDYKQYNKKKQQIKIKFRDKLFSLSKKNGGMMNILLKQI
jgi:hypothetical protein